MRRKLTVFFVLLGLATASAAEPVETTFWGRDFRKQFGEFLEVPVPAGRIAVLFPNEDVMQLHGHSARLGRSISGRRFGKGRKIENVGLRSELGSSQGNFMILLLPAPREQSADEESEETAGKSEGEATQEPRYDPERGQPALLRKKNRTFLLLNVHASEEGLSVELEERLENRAGPYHAGPVHDIVFVYEAAPDP